MGTLFSILCHPRASPLCFLFSMHILGSEVAEDLLFLAPFHRGRPLLVAAGEGLLFSLSSRRTQTQANVHERVWNAPVVLVGDLPDTHKHVYASHPRLFRRTLTSSLSQQHAHLPPHLDAHVRAADLWLGGGTPRGLGCRAPVSAGFWRRLCGRGVCQRDVYDRWICGGGSGGRRRSGRAAFCGRFIRVDLCEKINRTLCVNNDGSWVTKGLYVSVCVCGYYVTFDMAGGGRDPQSVEELVRHLVDHKETDFLPSCSNEGHHLRVPQTLYVHSIHLRQTRRRLKMKERMSW